MWDRLLLPVEAIEVMLRATMIWSLVVFVLDLTRETIEVYVLKRGKDDD